MLTAKAGLAGLATLLAALLAVSIWFLIKKKMQRIWLPALRVLQMGHERLPRLTHTRPPFWSFLSFVIGAALICFFAFKPYSPKPASDLPSEKKYHLLLDFSASMQAGGDLGAYQEKVVTLWQTLSKLGVVSLSTTLGPEIFNPQSLKELQATLKQFDFHRAGVFLGNAVAEQRANLGDLDRLIVFSDGDLHSWSDFNWQFLSDQMQVFWHSFRPANAAEASNLFIDQVQPLSSVNLSSAEWEVSIRRSGNLAKAHKGKVVVVVADQEWVEGEWHLASGRKEVDVRLSLPLTRLQEVLNQVPDKKIVFRLSTRGQDSIALDNEFRTEFNFAKQNALLVAAPTGEHLLEDPAYHLQSSMQVMGFQFTRLDKISQPGPNAKDYPFWVLLGGEDENLDPFCPRNLENFRLASRPVQGAKSFGGDKIFVWLAPLSAEANFRSLCACYVRLMTSTRAGESEPSYCKDVSNSAGYSDVLVSLGAKQIGGALNDARKSIAFHSTHASGLEVLAFLVPLGPLRLGGFNYGQLPLAINSLLQWQGLFATSDNRNAPKFSWPRIADIAATLWQKRDVRESNVPMGESAMEVLDHARLPSHWDNKQALSGMGFQARDEQNQDPLFWLQLIAFAFLASMLMESIALLFTRKRKTHVAAGIVLFSWLGVPETNAEVALNLLGYGIGNVSNATLATETQNRTSIDLKEQVQPFTKIDGTLLAEGWFWVKNLTAIASGQGGLRRDVEQWLKSGGFLVLEGTSFSLSELQRLTGNKFAINANYQGWHPIPPDHELMRSFHLLDSLPGCQGQVWYGFQFDGRLAILAIPFDFVETLLDTPKPSPCLTGVKNTERGMRVFINILMVVLATDYKKDQIHLPEILKRLR